MPIARGAASLRTTLFANRPFARIAAMTRRGLLLLM